MSTLNSATAQNSIGTTDDNDDPFAALLADWDAANANDKGSRDEAHERYVSERNAIREINDAALASGEPVGDWITNTPYPYHEFAHASDTRIGTQISATPQQFIAALAKKEALPLPVNRGVLNSDDSSLLRKRKDGKVFMPVTFCDPHGGRKNGNVSKMHNLVVDIDNDPAFLQGRPQISERDIARALIELGLAGKIITSFSSTPDQPKFRVILWLRAPYLVRASLDDANGGKNEVLWEYAYDLIAKCFTPDYDKKCKNVARIWYWPADDVERDETQKYVVSEFVSGALLDIHALLAARPMLVRAPKKQSNDEPKSPKRMMFNHLYGAMKGQFSQGDAMLDLYGAQADEKEHDGANGVVSSCPKRFDHASELGNPDENKKPLMSFNADVAKHGRATSSCFHNSCNGRTAADFLFAAIEECRPEVLKSAKALWRFLRQHVCETHEDALDAALATWAPDDEEIEAAFDEIETAQDDQKKPLARAFLKRVAVLPEGADTATLFERLQPFLGWSVTKAEAMLKAERKMIKKARASLAGGSRRMDHADAPTVPEDAANASVIWDTWGHSDRCRVAIAIFEKKNNESPTIFVDATGKHVRLSKRGDQAHLEPIEGRDKWSSVLSDFMTFKCAATERAPEREVKPFDDVVGYLTGAKCVDVPTLKRIVNVPMFDGEGVLRTEEGYSASGETWLHPTNEYRVVPDVLTENDVSEARYWFGEAFIDFPFSDAFEGNDPYPVKGGDKDEDGHPLSPPERGLSSRTHAAAMCLTPFVRSMLKDGKAPAFFIDKSEPGSGAGYLADVAGYMLYAAGMPPKDLPRSEEEVSKVILASIMRGKPTLFLDNINHDVDSASLAALLTASSIEGRILGTSNYIDVAVETVVMLAANNGKLTDELMRRVIPIRLDHALPDPSASRPADYYKYVHHDFLRQHRADLVWSAHVLVKWWLQNGAPPPSHGRNLASFSDWSRVVGGVLERAGIDGFLGSLKAFNAARKEDGETEVAFLSRVLARYPVGAEWNSSDAYTCALPPMGGDRPDPSLMLGLKGRDEGEWTTALSYKLRKWCGKTYAIGGDHYQFVRGKKEEDGRRYTFVKVAKVV